MHTIHVSVIWMYLATSNNKYIQSIVLEYNETQIHTSFYSLIIATARDRKHYTTYTLDMFNPLCLIKSEFELYICNIIA